MAKPCPDRVGTNPDSLRGFDDVWILASPERGVATLLPMGSKRVCFVNTLPFNMAAGAHREA
jgi:hypothetical protein